MLIDKYLRQQQRQMHERRAGCRRRSPGRYDEFEGPGGHLAWHWHDRSQGTMEIGPDAVPWVRRCGDVTLKKYMKAAASCDDKTNDLCDVEGAHNGEQGQPRSVVMAGSCHAFCPQWCT
jgi:hypothetical protein